MDKNLCLGGKKRHIFTLDLYTRTSHPPAMASFDKKVRTFFQYQNHCKEQIYFILGFSVMDEGELFIGLEAAGWLQTSSLDPFTPT